MFRGYWNALLDMIYPPKCPVCKISVEKHGVWCSSCLGKIVSIREINVQQHHLTSLDSCQVVCEYTGGLKRLIHDMKFRQQKRYAIYLRWLLSEYSSIEHFRDIDYVIPIPLHAQRLRERGYNQVESIFKDWAMDRQMNWMPNLLTRTHQTIPQWELNTTERRENIKGSFAVIDPKRLMNKHILIVDDIVTTGITLDECAKVLKKAGAIRVDGLAVASGAH